MFRIGLLEKEDMSEAAQTKVELVSLLIKNIEVQVNQVR